MPRTRLVWHLFVGWCALVSGMLVACFWLSSVRLAEFADGAQRRRLSEAATAVTALLGVDGRPTDPRAFAATTAGMRAAAGIVVDVLDPAGGRLTEADGGPPPTAPLATDDGLLKEAHAGRAALATRFDVASGRRALVMAVPHGPPAAPVAIVSLTADTSAADAALTAAQRGLLLGHLACGLGAALVGFIVARRTVRPVTELRQAAVQLATGQVDAPLPATDLVELADIAAAFGLLRAQLVESGLTIGRQGTQQQAVLGSMIEGVVAIDARQRLLGINRAAADLLDVNLERIIGRPLQEVIRNPDLRRFALLAIDCREPVEDDLVLHGIRDRTIRLRGTALRDASGEGGAVIVLNDVTDMQRLENVRRDFVANVSHELKTPVASIKGFVETLLDGAADDPADNRRFLEIVARQADRLAAIIEDLLALSRIEQSEGSGTLPMEPQPLLAILAAAAEDCRPRAIERSIQLDVECPPDLTATVNGPLLEQAVINLVDNAIKYSEPGKTVWMSAAHDGGCLIRVRDEGCGIAAEHLPRLFERFYRVDKARSRQQGGTGLGLAIVKHIVQAHGGTVAVESTPGVGTTFTLRLPNAALDDR
ncbi:MAG: ATP-binding protein [Planctomycetaceae bacterium]|jgi:two-component system phosphate regulon sensor histidine kinase PhoR|nr:ATP-binding protein [Planctomycetaceae bacterium]